MKKFNQLDFIEEANLRKKLFPHTSYKIRKFIEKQASELKQCDSRLSSQEKELRKLILRMIEPNADKRPSAQEGLKIIDNILALSSNQ